MPSNTTGLKIKNKQPSKIIGIQFSVLSPEEIIKSSVAEITSRDTYVNNKPVIGGLFDPRMGVLEPGFICPTDGLDYMQTPGYFGHIVLARPVYYIQYLTTILKVLRVICFKCSKLLLNKENFKNILDLPAKKRFDKVFSIASKIGRCGEENSNGCGCLQPKKIKKEGLATIIAEWDGGDDRPIVMNLTCEQVLKIFKRISDDDITFMGFSPLWSRPEWFICQVLAVPPPAVRPSIKHDAQQRSEDDISHIIINIIKANKTLEEKISQNAPGNIIDDWSTMLQYYIATMINNKLPGVSNVTQRTGRALKSIVERLNGKGGRVRGNLMGKRVDFSARSVITPDANLNINQLGIPKKVAINITYPEVVNNRNKNYLLKLVQNGPDVYPGAKILERKNGDNISLRYIDRESIVLENGDIVHRHMMDGDPVLFNRQPTLHRMSMMCHVAKIMKEGSTFRMNVADTKPYNADFDGDEMNMHNPQEEESAAELLNLAAVPRQIISPANNKSIIGIFQDSLLGCYRFTRDNINFTPRQAMNLLMAFNKIDSSLFNDNKKLISSFELLSQILPPLSCKFSNKSFDGDKENKADSNNIIEVVNGDYKRGQMDVTVLGSMSKGFIQSIFNDFGFQASADFIDNLQNIVTEYMKLSAYSVGISDLIANKETTDKIVNEITKKKKKVKDIIDQTHIGVFENNTGKSNKDEFESQVNAILNDAQSEAGKIGTKSLDKDNRFVIMVNAGSKGKQLNIAQMISCLGQQNVDGKRIPYGYDDRTLPHYNKFNDSPQARGFVESSFIQGLTPEEMFFHAMGGRTGLIDTAVKTSTTGYIQRRLIKGMEDLKVHYDMTVRNNKNKVIQFSYGDDSFDTTKVEGQNINIVEMALEDIYTMFQPVDNKGSKDIFTPNVQGKMYKEHKELIVRSKEVIDTFLDNREKIVKNVFNSENNNKVYLPVKFTRIINNIKNQMHITKESLVDVTPLEYYNMIDNAFENLNYHFIKPTDLFKIVYYYHLSPLNMLIMNRFNKNAINLLLETITLQYKRAIVHPGEMVGMIAAQSIGEPTTQMTLNTFHFAGVASKSNVTRGVPRIDEILTLSENPKNPSITVELKKKDRESTEHAQEVMYSLEHACLKDIVKSVRICFDPNDLATNIDEDKLLLEEYYEFQTLTDECIGNEETTQSNDKSKWIIRFEMDRESMLNRNINMDDVHYCIKNSYEDKINCIYSDFNSDKLIFRVRVKEFNNSRKKQGLDESDQIYMLKNIQETLLNNIILRGVKNISKVNLRKVQNNVILENDKYNVKEGWVLDTVGSNLSSILTLQNINTNKTTSNDIQEVYRVLGIEAARQTIYNELIEVIEFDGTYINSHHLDLLCDRMCATIKLVSIFRHGINNDDIGPIAQASFEETPEMFLRAAKHAELDNMNGVSANIMCGQHGNYGTSSFQVYMDIEKVKSMNQAVLEKQINIDSQFELENPDDVCSKTKLNIDDSTVNIGAKDSGDVMNGFDLDI